jgi:hypothetical protein
VASKNGAFRFDCQQYQQFDWKRGGEPDPYRNRL